MIPRELAQARLIELVEAALELVPDQRGGAPSALGKMSRDQLITYILDQRERKDRHFRRLALELMNRNSGLLHRLAS